MTAEHVSTPPNADPGQLGRMLLRTCHLSFAISQVNQSLNERLLLMAGAYYHDSHTPASLKAAADTACERVATLPIPHNHVPITPVKAERQFEHHWGYLLGATFYPHIARYDDNIAYDPTEPQCERTLAEIAEMMIGQDEYYMRTTRRGEWGKDKIPFAGRPVGTSGRDPRQSLVRDYVLEQAPFQDAALATILSDIRPVLVGSRPLGTMASYRMSEVYGHRLPLLASRWETHHPGQQFIDPALYAGTPLLACLRPDLAQQ